MTHEPAIDLAQLDVAKGLPLPGVPTLVRAASTAWLVAAAGSVAIGVSFATWVASLDDQLTQTPLRRAVVGVAESQVPQVELWLERWAHAVRNVVVVDAVLTVLVVTAWVALSRALTRGSGRARTSATVLVVLGVPSLLFPLAALWFVPAAVGVVCAWTAPAGRYLGREPRLARRAGAGVAAAGSTASAAASAGLAGASVAAAAAASTVAQARELADRHDVAGRTRRASAEAASVAGASARAVGDKAQQLGEKHDVRGRAAAAGRLGAVAASRARARVAGRRAGGEQPSGAGEPTGLSGPSDPPPS